MTENQEKMKWLSSYRNVKIRIESLKQQIQKLNERATSITQNYSAIGGCANGNVNDKIGEIVVQIQSLNEKLLEELQNETKIENEIRTAIYKMENPLYKTILEERYLMLHKWDKIARKVNYSVEHTSRYLLDRAVTILSLPLEK